MIAVEADYQYVDGKIGSNQNHKLVNELPKTTRSRCRPVPSSG
jgi:hypothetical protein